jgi:K+-transporting ATPase KdpF subunit
MSLEILLDLALAAGLYDYLLVALIVPERF